MKLFLLFLMLWGASLLALSTCGWKLTFPPLVQRHIGYAKLHKKCSLGKKKFNKNIMYVSCTAGCPKPSWKDIPIS